MSSPADVMEEGEDAKETDGRPRTEERLEVGAGSGSTTTNPMLLITSKAKKVHSAPTTERVAPSSLLQRVKSFLPLMEAEQKTLEERILRGEDVRVDNPQDDDERFVEMNVGLVEREEKEEWSADSDPDSAPSPPRPGKDDANANKRTHIVDMT